MALKYDFPSNGFTTFENGETPKLIKNSPLFGELDFSDVPGVIGLSDTGIPIYASNISEETETSPKPIDLNLNNPNEVEIKENVPVSGKTIIDNSSQANALSNLIDEVSNEKGFEDLKNPLNKKLLMLQAQRESRYDPSAKSSHSTASGYFQMIDGTRKKFSSVSKDEFLNNPKEQVRAAYKYLKNILDTPNAKKLLNKGYNYAQVTALGWWLPASMNDVLNGNFNRSLGGYSIKQALEDYGQFKI